MAQITETNAQYYQGAQGFRADFKYLLYCYGKFEMF